VVFSYISTPYLVNNNQQVAISNQTSYKVVKGDNLWNIGYKLNVDNISKFIFEVKKVNNLGESTLSVDQIIKIP
jgi:LysM repeat protein